MKSIAIPQAGLLKLVILVTGIVVAMFLATVLVALAFMPSQLIVSMPGEDIRFLVPLILSTVCSAIVLGRYVRTHMSSSKN